MDLTWPQVLAWRLQQHYLEPVGDASVTEVVERLGAVLAMDEAAAELSVGRRRSGSQPGELARALEAGRLVMAYAFRGATHYLSPATVGPTSPCAPRAASGSCRAGRSTTPCRRSSGPTSGRRSARRSPTAR